MASASGISPVVFSRSHRARAASINSLRSLKCQ